jgi:hypothetical protein
MQRDQEDAARQHASASSPHLFDYPAEPATTPLVPFDESLSTPTVPAVLPAAVITAPQVCLTTVLSHYCVSTPCPPCSPPPSSPRRRCVSPLCCLTTVSQHRARRAPRRRHHRAAGVSHHCVVSLLCLNTVSHHRVSPGVLAGRRPHRRRRALAAAAAASAGGERAAAQRREAADAAPGMLLLSGLATPSGSSPLARGKRLSQAAAHREEEPSRPRFSQSPAPVLSPGVTSGSCLRLAGELRQQWDAVTGGDPGRGGRRRAHRRRCVHPRAVPAGETLPRPR